MNNNDSHRREYLKPYHGKRIQIEGRIQKFSQFFDPRMRTYVPSACLQDVDVWETDTFRWTLCDHIWIAFAATLHGAGADIGDVIRTSVVVYQYPWTDNDVEYMRFGIRDPQNVEIVRRLGLNNRPFVPPVTVKNAMEPASVLDSITDCGLGVVESVVKLIREHGLDAVEQAIQGAKLGRG